MRYGSVRAGFIPMKPCTKMKPFSLLLLLHLLALPARAQVLINEFDADQTGTDAAEFVELYDGGVGHTDLSGLVLVFFNGSDDASYEAFDLDGFETDDGGFFVLCGDAANVPDCDLDVSPETNLIQNGTDAIALYAGDAADFPEDTPVTTLNLLDAVVYDTNDSDDAALLVLLNPGEAQLNEDDGGNKDTESLQRSPDGAGGARNTSAFVTALPTPGTANFAVVPETRVQFAGATGDASEGDGPVPIPVTLTDPDAVQTTTVEVVLTGGTATGGADFVPFATQVLTFPAGSDAPQTFTVTLVDDAVPEDVETLVFALQNPAGGHLAALGAQTQFILNLVDDDGSPGAFQTTATLVNGGGGPLDGTDVFPRNAAGQTVVLTLTGPPDGSLGGLTDVTLTVPEGWTGLHAATVTLAGDGFAGATATVAGQTLTLSGADLADTRPGTVTLAGLTTPDPVLPGDDGHFVFGLLVAQAGLPATALPDSPVALVTVPLAALHEGDDDGLPLLTGAVVAVEGTATTGAGTFEPGSLLAFIQDDEAGVAVANDALLPAFVAGNAYVVRGLVDPLDGLTRVIPATHDDLIDLGAATPVVPAATEIRDLKGSSAEQYEGRLVTLTGVTLVEGLWPEPGHDATLTIADTTPGTLALFIDHDTDLDDHPRPFFPATLTGILSQADAEAPFTSGYRLMPRSAADVVGAAVPDFVTRVQFARETATVSEINATVTIDVTITDPHPFEATSVDVALTFGSARNGEDILPFTTQTLVFPAGSRAVQSVSVTTHDDAEDEPLETLIFTLENPRGGAGATLGMPDRFTLFVEDNEITIPSTLLINEFDADQTGTDAAEFVELYDGGVGHTDLSGLVLVFFNGSDDASYEAFDLDGFETDDGGFFVLCGDAANVPDCDLDVSPETNLIQNGTDAIALYAGDAADFPEDTPVTTLNLLDAVVYNTDDPFDDGLQVLLNPDQPQLDEDVNGTKDTTSLQRLPDGAGGARNTVAYQPLPPSPGQPNGVVTTTLVQFGAADVTALETDGAVTGSVTILNPDPATPTTVEVALTGGTAAGGVDAEAFSPLTLTFPAGSDAPQPFTVVLVDDAEIEEEETLVFTLQNAQGGDGAAVGTPDTFTLTIFDDDRSLLVSIAGARLLPDGTRVTVEGLVTRARGAFTRLQDETGGLVVRQTAGAFFDAVAAADLAPGDLIQVTGALSTFAARREINEADLERFTVLSRGNPLPAPPLLTLADLAAGGETYESMVIRVEGLTVETTDTVFAAATTYDLADASLPAGTVTLRIPNAGDTDADGLDVPLRFTFEGVLGQFSFGDPAVGYQLEPVEAADLLPETGVAVEEEGALPESFQLRGNYPDPFNPATTIRFDLPGAAVVRVDVFDVMGRRVLTLPGQPYSAGRSQAVVVDAGRLSSGVYLYRLTARAAQTTYLGTGTMTLLK